MIGCLKLPSLPVRKKQLFMPEASYLVSCRYAMTIVWMTERIAFRKLTYQ